MIDRWLSLPVPALVFTVAAFYGGSALLLIYLCFGRLTGAWVQSFRGVVAPFIGGIVVILGILIGFLANDVWDRNRRAASTVRREAASLLSLHDLVAASGLPDATINCAIRDYVTAVTEKEWPSMAEGEALRSGGSGARSVAANRRSVGVGAKWWRGIQPFAR